MVDPESRRAVGDQPERRRYTRRPAPQTSPDYYGLFERMAVALEDVARFLEAASSAESGSVARHVPVPPRRSQER